MSRDHLVTQPSNNRYGFKILGDVIKLLPTGTVFAFQFLSPLLTHSGQCSVAYKAATGVLLFICGFSCFFSSFTDTYVDAHGNVHYCIMFCCCEAWFFITPTGGVASGDRMTYRLGIRDMVHALLALVMFAVGVLQDNNTVSCYYPSFATDHKPPKWFALLGAFASFVFAWFPSNRHGIGYHPSAALRRAAVV